MKRILIVVVMLTMSLSSISQNLSNDVNILERHCGGLRYCGMKDNLTQDDLKQLLDEESYAMYENVRKHHAASIPLWVVTGVTTTVSTLFLYGGVRGHIYFNNHPEEYGYNGSPIIKTPLYQFFYIFSAIGYGMSLVTGIPATILTIQTHRNLDIIVENYNANSNAVSLNFKATSNGIGLVLKF